MNEHKTKGKHPQKKTIKIHIIEKIEQDFQALNYIEYIDKRYNTCIYYTYNLTKSKTLCISALLNKRTRKHLFIRSVHNCNGTLFDYDTPSPAINIIS